ncbi:hypothetical protein [Streptomyces sp. NPDC002088]|uniref:beta barrel domain-containing protein n=1 Tax=Streptomyces sp. NPDC002088 TaxID=3154665 RepID=UPI003320F675
MARLDGVKVGDTLLLFVRMGGQREKEQEPKVVTVVKVGRDLVHIPKYESDPEGKTETYRIESGYRNDNYRHTQLMTREAWADDKKREELFVRLLAYGLTGHLRGSLSTEALEAVVNVLDEFKAKEGAE